MSVNIGRRREETGLDHVFLGDSKCHATRPPQKKISTIETT